MNGENLNSVATGLEQIPSSIHAEKTILGALLLDSSRLADVAGALNSKDFFLDSHRRIFDAMVSVDNEFKNVDIVTLANELNRRKETEAVGGVAYLASLTEGLPRRSEIDDYIRIVKDKSICRDLIRVATSISSQAYSQDLSGLEIASRAATAISSIAGGSVRAGADIFDAAQMAVEAEDRLINDPAEDPAIPTGIQALDEFTSGGIRLGELWVIGAAPSRGKTTLARQIIKHAICCGVACYVHSGEMSWQSWFDATACLIAEMPAWKTREASLMDLNEREKLRVALRRLGEMPLHLSDSGGIHLDRLIWNATHEKRKHGIRVFVIDYAQIINAPGRDERQKVTEVAQRLRLFAKEENVATILLSQSPRPENRGINTRPTMFSLKESGALEEAAHTVILPFRPQDLERGEFTGEDELIIAKQRWGSIGTIPVFLNGKFLRFESR